MLDDIWEGKKYHQMKETARDIVRWRRLQWRSQGFARGGGAVWGKEVLKRGSKAIEFPASP